MTDRTRVAIIGDYDGSFEPHVDTDRVFEDTPPYIDHPVTRTWIPTDAIGLRPGDWLHRYHGVWIAPKSPYRNPEGVLAGIRYARTHGVPVFGTCAGFQHLALEYARNMTELDDADSHQYDPNADTPLVTLLACSLAGQVLPVSLEPDSRAARLYGMTSVSERYYCRYGLNPAYQPQLAEAGLRFTGVDPDGEPRVLELPDHPFYLGTLFVPQARSTRTHPHPLILGFLRAAEMYRLQPAMTS